MGGAGASFDAMRAAVMARVGQAVQAGDLPRAEAIIEGINEDPQAHLRAVYCTSWRPNLRRLFAPNMEALALSAAETETAAFLRTVDAE